jgi:hypothetical protein
MVPTAPYGLDLSFFFHWIFAVIQICKPVLSYTHITYFSVSIVVTEANF